MTGRKVAVLKWILTTRWGDAGPSRSPPPPKHTPSALFVRGSWASLCSLVVAKMAPGQEVELVSVVAKVVAGQEVGPVCVPM